MPEAAVNKNDPMPDGKDKIGRARQAAVVQPISVTQRMHQPAHNHFGARVLAPD